jgi:hypothetical protein
VSRKETESVEPQKPQCIATGTVLLATKFIKKDENPEGKTNEAKEQIERYEKDEKFLRLASDTTILKYILVGSFDSVEILKVD